MTRGGLPKTIARYFVYAVFALWAAVAPAAPVAEERILPDLDRGLACVLDFEVGSLNPAPPPASFATEADYKVGLARVGDIAYDDADGGLLFVASGAAVALGTAQPSATDLRALESRFEKRDFLRGRELDAGAWLALRTRSGRLVVARVVTRNAGEIWLAWAPPVAAQGRITTQWIAAIAAVGPPVITTRLLPPLEPLEPQEPGKPASEPLDTVLRLADGAFAPGPRLPPPFSANQLADLVKGVRGAGDLGYLRDGSGILVVASGSLAQLGLGPVAPLARRDLRARLRSRSILTASEFAPGHKLLVATRGGRHAVLRIDAIKPQGLQISYLLDRDGSGIFPDLAAFDATQAQPSQGELDRRLLAAAARGDLLAMQRLIELGADPNTTRGRDQRPALIHAVIDGDIRSANLLLASGADPNTQDQQGWSALHAGAQLGRLDLVEALIASGADASLLTAEGKSALAIALESPRRNRALLRVLRRASATPDTLALVARVGDTQSLAALLEQGAEVDARDDRGRTALYVAAASGELEVLRALLDAGADPRLESASEDSPLVAATRAGHAPAVSALLDHGGFEEAQKANALLAANEKNDADLARLLLGHGADPELRSGSAMPSLSHAMQYGDDALVQVYVDAGYELSVPAAARLGRSEELAGLLEQGGDPSEPSPNGSAPLAEAIENQHAQTLRVLLDHGADPGVPLPSWNQRYPLHVAAEQGARDLVVLLLDQGVDPDPVDRVGRTPLYDAVVLGQEDTARVLLEHGADPKLAPQGETMIDFVRSESLRKLLQDYGAVPGPLPRAAD